MRRRVPFIPQLETTECGAACLAMIASAHDHHLPLTEARALCNVTRDGTSALSLVRAAESIGFEADAYQLEAESLDALPLPAILHWELNHFVVLEHVGRGRAVVVDPARGRRALSAQELSSAFSGVAIGLSRSAAFTRRRRAHPSARRYVAALRERAGAALLALLAALLLEALAVVFPAAVRLVVDLVAVPRQPRWLLAVAVTLALSVGLRAQLTMARCRLLAGLRQLLDLRTVCAFVDHVLRLPATFFLQRSPGDLVSRVEGNIALRDVTMRLTTSALDGLVVFAYAALLLASDRRLGALVVAFAAIRVVVPALIVRRGREALRTELGERAREGTVALDALSAPETVRAFSAEDLVVERFERRTLERSNAEERRRAATDGATAVAPVLEGAMRALLLWLGGVAVMEDRMTAGTFASFIAIGALLERPLQALLDATESTAQIGAHLLRVDDVWAAAREHDGAIDPGAIEGAVTFDRVSFRYGAADALVLDDVSFTIRPGERVAIVGRSGAGKSTLAKLLLGALVPTSGAVRFDERDLREVDLEAVRAQVGVVTQEEHVFSQSVRDNIALGAPELPLADVRAAARIACIHDDVMALPDGYETKLAGGGRNLSGGQRQRVALARALARRPRVLVLDEATSSLDLGVEAEIQRRLKNVDSTRIVIAHRLATARDADRLLVLDAGRLVDQGTFDELASRPGVLRDMLASREA